MYAAKFIAVAAAIFAVADARKHKKKHAKKDNVARGCVNAKEATFVIDGISKSTSKDLLKDIPNDVAVTFLLNHDEIRSRRNNKFLKKLAAKNEHILAYRFRPSLDKRDFQKTSPKKLVSNVKRAKALFKKNYGYELKFVYFPWTKKNLNKQHKAVEAAGFKVFGNNLDVQKNLHKHGKGKIERNIKQLAKSKKNGVIVYQTAHNTKVAADRDWVEHKLENKGFKIVTLEQCLGQDESSSEEEEVVTPTPATDDANMAAVQQAATESEPDAASTLTFSAVGVAAVALLMLVL